MSRYSQLYIERGKPASDSPRARVRMKAIFLRLIPKEYFSEVSSLLTEKLGTEVDYAFLADTFFVECVLRDLLDSVTIIFDFLNFEHVVIPYSEFDFEPIDQWRSEVSQIFEQENLGYRVDEDAIVHPYVDAEFEINRQTALEALGDPRFGEARKNFEAAYRHLRGQEYRQTIRMMFPAVETAAKVLFPGKFSRLGTNEVERYIKPIISQRYSGNEPAILAGGLLLDGMKNWINAAHQYRHGQETKEPTEPPDDFVIAHLSAGATYLRWMIELCPPPNLP